MRIWILQAYDQPNGQSTRSHSLASRFVNSGHEVYFFTNSYCHFLKTQRHQFKGNHMVESTDGFQAVWLKTNPYSSSFGRLANMFENFVRIHRAAMLLQAEPDVIITPSVPPSTALAGLILSWRYRCKLVYEIRDVWPAVLLETGVISRFNPIFYFFKMIENLMYRQSDLVVSTLSKVHDHVVNNGGKREKILVIPNGLARTILSEVSQPPAAIENDVPRLDVTPGIKSVLYIGGYGIDHDVLTLVKAAEKLRDNVDIQFHCFGDGGGKQTCMDYAQEAGLTNIKFYAPISKNLIMRLQSTANVLYAGITDSPTYRFGINLNKLLYYVASGKPIVFCGNEVPQFFIDYKIASLSRCGDVDSVAENIRAACDLSRKEIIRQKLNALAAFEDAIDFDKHFKLYSNTLTEIYNKSSEKQ